MSTLRSLALLAAVASATAAADPEPDPPAGKADIVGEVKTFVLVDMFGGKMIPAEAAQMLVEGKKGMGTAHAKANVLILREAAISRWQGGKKVAARLEDIKPGCKVQCVFKGPARDTDPVTAWASEVVSLSSPGK